VNKAWLLFVTATLAACPVCVTVAPDLDRMADAIYRIEGGARARVPYGILSVPVRDAAEARRVCKNTVRNQWARWQAAGRPGCYLDSLADRYCPPGHDPVGNRNWKRNIRSVLFGPAVRRPVEKTSSNPRDFSVK
jgi:hypothetical protein